MPWNKWKWGHNNPKSVGHWESNPNREIHSTRGLYQKQEKSSNKWSNITLKRTCNRTTNKAQSEKKAGNHKSQNRNKINRV